MKKFRRRLKGVVVSDVNDKTIVVNVQRRFKHPIYEKFMTRSHKYHAHDASNSAKVGDRVTIIESRPFSSKKHWELWVPKS
ncbi:MAG: 30S ribosomal protein S17 [Bacteriovoracales bacterium]|nr:30S ribosomal protein S17 [Bacteriovoracales bacterium]